MEGLNGDWTGRETKALRSALRLSMIDFASYLGVAHRTVAKWEELGANRSLRPRTQEILDAALSRASGEQRARFFALLAKARPREHEVATETSTDQPHHAVIIDECMREDVPRKDVGPSAVARLIGELTANDMATRREVLAGLATLSGGALVGRVRHWAAAMPTAPVETRQVGAAEVAELEQAVKFFRRWDASGVGGLHRKAVVGQLNAVAETLSVGNHTARVDQRLFHVAAELAQLAGWMAYDAGAHALGQRYYLQALNACRVIGAVDLGAKVVGDMAQMSTALGHYDDSVALTQYALAMLPRGGNPLVRAELHGLAGRAYAQLGPNEAGHARRAADACAESFAQAPAESRLDWIHYMTSAEAACLAANVHTELAFHEPTARRAEAHAARAEEYVNVAIRHREKGYTRSRALDQLRLAKVRAAQREPAEAANIALVVLGPGRQVPPGSAVVTAWLTGLYEPLRRHHGSVDSVRLLGEALHDYTQRTRHGDA